ncbi:ribose-phosphate pyrophosphokinase [Rhizobium leguminosarum bv. viciae]|uniref:ribose-phosphate diphosphokinase n=1 Tax=Rhizobium TaxID=379 RepID=UPI0003F4D79F|nr:ribose-phosphate diphosphokinase [Rhizobium leguminosarum]MBY5344426.1 ribose-phosphate pyrophosphokinase [Rhizobium leguminosarum]NEK46586.1 ribose-phosphate diphosphokinase [Rhizobium leguminosarum]NKK53018.1 ribose-phosphate diphosphokinase [Rhizobium leguminosarum bv. viciae]NKL23621.1 ribose-phosphate diphosphokinase [Rhizobium leguminosarum bv. viciae]NKL57615.1 ribose-phosphate diphosphokinase [Rhizobium leguminosarum bv. viciae]
MRLFALQESRILGEAVATRLGIILDTHEERRFDDGEHKTRPLVSVHGEDVYIIQSLGGDQTVSANDKLCKLLFFAAACRENGAAQVSTIVPYLAYARKDRQTKARDPVTLKYVAQLFEAMGVARVVTVDVHNVAAFQNAFRCATINLTSFDLFYPHIEWLVEGGPVTILSPDAGGIKRAQLIRESFERVRGTPVGLAMMEKRRSEDVVTSDLFAGDVEGRCVIIVDDLIATGTTILHAAQACLARGAKKVIAVAAHGHFTGGSTALFAEPAVAQILVTDSLSHASLHQKLHAEKLTVCSLAPRLAEAIRRLRADEDVTGLTAIQDL